MRFFLVFISKRC